MTTDPHRDPQLPAVLDGFDLTDQARFSSGFPHEVFAQLRRDAHVLFHPPGHSADGVGFWVLSKHADVRAAAEEPALSSSGGGGRPHGGTHLDDARPELPGVMINMMDDPRHRDFKDALSPGLGPQALAALEAKLRAYTAELVAGLVARGTCDFAADSAAIGTHAIALLLGIPPQDRPVLAEWTEVLMGFDDREAGQPTERSRALHMDLFRYGSRLLAEKRAAPSDDLTSVLARVELAGAPDGGPLTDRERQTTFCLMALAGTESTRNAIAAGVLALIQHPDQWRALRADRSLLPGAVEEILRWSSPTPYNRRTATRDLRIRDAEICAGDKVTLWWSSANRDEDVFAAPFTFDIRRGPNPHLAFGAGTHGCFGAQLGRLELRVVLEALLDQVQSLELTGPLVWAPSNKHTVLLRMPTALTPAARPA
ncbi:MAG TPA: cytochrome P450 [Kofleriaceae bacterium]|nr:cytochrome P450 [Kofleriaceae bacterium]